MKQHIVTAALTLILLLQVKAQQQFYLRGEIAHPVAAFLYFTDMYTGKRKYVDSVPVIDHRFCLKRTLRQPVILFFYVDRKLTQRIDPRTIKLFRIPLLDPIRDRRNYSL
ncbi:hypothetical protein [Sphingobacterium sp. CZ-UAM]|uniref:hypothetical protein n=1 Tax=Sphingobacterium sp. CZ-UAM TaxID=1933868 RepID=UPI0011158A48|nr:hypothetical protein [Sphingobacterium sp. CZ-UAM]